jgi:hypothetical protein
MQTISSKAESTEWPRKVRFGLATVHVYHCKTASGKFGYMVPNYATGKRRPDSYHRTDDENLAV